MATSTSAPIVKPAELTRALADLHKVRPWHGLVRSAITIPAVLLCFAVALFAQSIWLFLVAGICGALLLGTIAITTHDAIHHTLTGWAWFDEILPRVVSYPVLWPHGLYSELHKIHHKMNGQDIEDPERMQWTQEEYEKASGVGRWAFRNQFFLAVFVSGGFGFIYEHFQQGIKFGKRSRAVRRALLQDVCAIVVLNVTLYSIMAHFNLSLQYLMFYLFLERLGGGILQFRAYIEHYGLWGKQANYFETQIFTCRNIKTNLLMSLYFNRLNFHSVHHAFPTIPFYNLPVAHSRLSALYHEKGTDLVEADGYLKTAVQLARAPRFIPLSPAPQFSLKA